MLIYGQLPRGPLAVRKVSWTAQRAVRAEIGRPVEDCMDGLRRRLEDVADWVEVELRARHGQEVYVHSYNLRSKDKHFNEGDTVIMLSDESKANVLHVKSQYTCNYLVDMGDGRVRHVHANKMRKFYGRVQGCNVISECDDDIGRVLVPVTVPCDVLPSTAIGHSKIEHLHAEQQTELLALLDEFHVCFGDKRSLCSVAERRMRVTANFQLKRLRSTYRVPEVMKQVVERQIKELLNAGLTNRSHGPVTSPLVCVWSRNKAVFAWLVIIVCVRDRYHCVMSSDCSPRCVELVW